MSDPELGPHDPSPAVVIGYWTYMADHFKTTQVEKGDSIAMVVVATLLDALKILSKDSFLKDYTTTIAYPGMDTIIYTNFKIGDPAWGRNLWSQMRTCCHEHQHAFQASQGTLVFDERYLVDTHWRAYYESHAYICNCEMEWWRSKTMDDPAMLAAKLKNYGCDQRSIDEAHKNLVSEQATIRQGGIVTEAFRWSKPWLDGMPYLKLVE